jgi:hypothetical protein
LQSSARPFVCAITAFRPQYVFDVRLRSRRMQKVMQFYELFCIQRLLGLTLGAVQQILLHSTDSFKRILLFSRSTFENVDFFALAAGCVA